MPKRKKAPELTFQRHIADYLVHEHKYGVLERRCGRNWSTRRFGCSSATG